MLSREMMGVLALGILWVNTLLIVASAVKEIAALAALRRAMREVTSSGETGLGLAAMDPRALCARKIGLASASVAGILAAAAGVTALALQRPYFGAVSTIGGALCLGFFLLVQPIGAALRNAMRLPHRASLHRGSLTPPRNASAD